MKLVLIGLVSFIAVLFAVGLLLPIERSAKRKTVIKANPEKVFATVTNLSDQKWRSRIGEIEIVDSTPTREVWIEKPQKGPKIKFRTKVKDSPNRFEIEIIDNPQFGGYWVGTFHSTSNGETEIEFSEHVVVHGILPKLLSYVFFNIEESVDTYIADLKRRVE